MAWGGGLYCEGRWNCIEGCDLVAEGEGIRDRNGNETKALSFQKTPTQARTNKVILYGRRI